MLKFSNEREGIVHAKTNVCSLTLAHACFHSQKDIKKNNILNYLYIDMFI